MNCGYREKTILFFYGELPEEGAEAVKAHIGACRDCAAAIAVLEGLSAAFDAFRPGFRGLDAEELAGAARGTPLLPRLFPVFGRAAAAAAFTAVFLFAFRVVGPVGGSFGPAGPAPAAAAQAGWTAESDPGLDGVDSALYALRGEMEGAYEFDFDYGYSEVEDQKWRISV